MNQNASGTSTAEDDVTDMSSVGRVLDGSNDTGESVRYSESDECSNLIEADSDDDDYYDDDEEGEKRYEPKTPSGLIDSDSQAMIDSSGTPAGSMYEYSDSDTSGDESSDGQETGDEYTGVLTRGRKRKIKIDEKENQVSC